jgi:hypothetical protein
VSRKETKGVCGCFTLRTSRQRPAEHLLGWTPRSSEEAIIATAASLVRLGLLIGS